jgi:hypothetical protein
MNEPNQLPTKKRTRKKHPLSEKELEARRSNAQHSTGPRSHWGMMVAAMNALRHGSYCDLSYRNMLVLGEKPVEFERLRLDLLRAFQPADAAEQTVVERIAELRWLERRNQRAQEAFMVNAHDELRYERQTRQLDVSNTPPPAPEEELRKVGLMRLPDSLGKFMYAGAGLDFLLEASGRKDLTEDDFKRVWEEIDLLWGEKDRSSSGEVVDGLFATLWSEAKEQGRFAEGAEPKRARRARELTDEQEEREAARLEKASFKVLSDREQLRMHLYSDKHYLKQRYQRFVDRYFDLSPAQADACLALPRDPGRLLLRQQVVLAREIERQTKLLLHMQAERRKRPPEEAPPKRAITLLPFEPDPEHEKLMEEVRRELQTQLAADAGDPPLPPSMPRGSGLPSRPGPSGPEPMPTPSGGAPPPPSASSPPPPADASPAASAPLLSKEEPEVVAESRMGRRTAVGASPILMAANVSGRWDCSRAALVAGPFSFGGAIGDECKSVAVADCDRPAADGDQRSPLQPQRACACASAALSGCEPPKRIPSFCDFRRSKLLKSQDRSHPPNGTNREARRLTLITREIVRWGRTGKALKD